MSANGQLYATPHIVKGRIERADTWSLADPRAGKADAILQSRVIAAMERHGITTVDDAFARWCLGDILDLRGIGNVAFEWLGGAFARRFDWPEDWRLKLQAQAAPTIAQMFSDRPIREDLKPVPFIVVIDRLGTQPLYTWQTYGHLRRGKS